MLSRVHYFIRLLLFWLALFTSFRLLFIFSNLHELSHSHGDAMRSLVAGFRLDISTVAYLAIPSFLLWGLYQWTQKKIFADINTGYHYVVLFGITALFVGTIRMYHDWNTLLTYSIFDYLKNPGDVASFISYWELGFLFLCYFVYFGLSAVVFKKGISVAFTDTQSFVRKTAITLCLPGVLILMARGGWQLTPVNESAAYHSDHSFFNQVAINPFWYFVHSFLNRDPDKNPYAFMEETQALDRNNVLFECPDTLAPAILTTERPNIVLIILESWAADIVKSLNGESGVTPQFDSLQEDGLLFTEIYAAGSRTEHGLTSILNGFPPPPHISIITIPAKSGKLPSINHVLKDAGYTSSFYYGGEVEFANMKSLLLNSQFRQIIDIHHFSEDQLNGKWGAHDEFVFSKQLHDLKEVQQPFFSVILTLSSHEPFHVPVKTPFSGEDEANKFRSAAYYADRCLGAYFMEAKKQAWYDNTLFVLIADHGHRLPNDLNTSLPRAKHIPFLLYGPALKEEYRGKKVNLIGNQHDLVATLLYQLDLPSQQFPRSKNLLNPQAKSFAYYVNNSVMGWINQGGVLYYTFATNQFSLNQTEIPGNDSISLDSKAYLQTHFQDYLNY